MKRSIVDYEIIQGDSQSVTNRVKQFLSMGWQPRGKAKTFDTSYDKEIIFQCMVKYES